MQEFDKRKIFWHSRRGMLELDLLLVPFVNEVFDTLSKSEKLSYLALIDEEDQDIFAWLVVGSAPDHERYASIIPKILEHNKK